MTRVSDFGVFVSVAGFLAAGLVAANEAAMGTAPADGTENRFEQLLASVADPLALAIILLAALAVAVNARGES